MRNSPSGTAPALLLLALALASRPAWPEKVLVSEELERLQAQHGFTVVGILATEDAVGRADRAELYPRLRRLLGNFDHVIVQSPDGGVERVIILGEKVPFTPAPPRSADDDSSDEAERPDGTIVLRTERRGSQRAVTVSLEGLGGRRVSQTLLIDTGADFLVLPSSVAKSLGVPMQRFKEQELQTANGKVSARVGEISAVWLGDERQGNVRTAFIADDKLGGSGLLGMSVLGRFTLTIDDDAGTLTLAGKGADIPSPADGDETSPSVDGKPPDE